MNTDNNLQNTGVQRTDLEVSSKVTEPEGPKSVAIIIPCRNEEKYIKRCLDSLIANDYDKQFLEIVIVDGRSTDRTREIVEQYCQKHDFIRILDNKLTIKPAALNLGIKATKSDIVMRIDAHTTYNTNYISKLVEGLYKYKADNIGGIRKSDHGNAIKSKAIGITISHPFAAGNAYFRTGSCRIRKVDTVFCGCYRRDVLHRIGYFNEKLIRTQDREFNKRLIKSGGTIILDPSVKCTYFPRTKLKEYWKWNCSGAYWLYYARRFTKTKMISWRNVIPLIFVSIHFVLVLAFFLFKWLLPLFILPIFGYFFLTIIFSSKIALQEKSIRLAPIMMILFLMTHYGYGLGGIIGLTKSYILGKDLPK